MGEKMHKITMSNYQMQTLQNAFEHFIIRCRVKNLSEETITSYRSKVAHLDTLSLKNRFYPEEVSSGSRKSLNIAAV